MGAPARKIRPQAESGARLHRRRQRVVVRRASEPVPPQTGNDRRAGMQTLPGVGTRRVLDTIPDPDAIDRRRPVVLLDDVHDRLSEAYLEEADRLLESGLFDD